MEMQGTWSTTSFLIQMEIRKEFNWLSRAPIMSELEKDGDVSITINGSTFRLLKPLAYQAAGDRRVPCGPAIRFTMRTPRGEAGYSDLQPRSIRQATTAHYRSGSYLWHLSSRYGRLSLSALLLCGHLRQGDDCRLEGRYLPRSHGRRIQLELLRPQVRSKRKSWLECLSGYDERVDFPRIDSGRQHRAILFVAGSTYVGIPVTSNAFQTTLESGANKAVF